MSTSQTVQDYRLLLRFEELRNELLAEPEDARLERPLAYWALGNDRRLPLVLMGRLTGEIAQSSFDELRSTPGIGRKKLGTLLSLLERAATGETTEHDAAFKANGANGHHANGLQGNNGAAAVKADEDEEFDPDAVSETAWEHWQEAVRRHQLEAQPLGRFAASLQELPRVIWCKPLGEYLGLSLAQLREMRTHGVKRIKAVTAVFHDLYQAVGPADSPHLTVIVRPRFVCGLESWLADALKREDFPSRDELVERLLNPLFDQLRIDAGDEVVDLAAGKLGLSGRKRPVRLAAAERGLTRARIYQMIGEMAEIMNVRWPEGAVLIAELRARYESSKGPLPRRRWFHDALDLFYPRRRKQAD